jgi:two-component system cell cycle sensor histidine kinase/response regulator CckA
MRVLIVDDEPSILEVERRVLSQAGYEAVTAAGGAEALSLVDGAPFDLVVADLKMPGMDGDEMARQLRARHPNLKILFVTGYADNLFLVKPVLWEDEAYLDKPFTSAGLREAVSLLLSGHVRQSA